MAFVDAIFTFKVELNIPHRRIGESVLFKVPKFSVESVAGFYARVLTYLHCYQPDLQWCKEHYHKKLPTLYLEDEIGQLQSWIEVGCPEKRKIELALRLPRCHSVCVYLWNSEDVDHFCQFLKGSRSNWIEPVEFYRIDEAFLGDLPALSTTRVNWSLTVVDDMCYLTVEQSEFVTEIAPFDIWAQFQTVIAND